MTDEEEYAALWKAAPCLPRLPTDAPDYLTPFVSEVQDPRDLYVLQRGHRRYHFQLLVEKFMQQLRFGCDDPRCSTPNCFTSRKRSAGSKPLRGYTTTSARALACHLAGQDNPDRALCPYMKLEDRSHQLRRKPFEFKANGEPKWSSNKTSDDSSLHENSDQVNSRVKGATRARVHSVSGVVTKDQLGRCTISHEPWYETTKIDHKSFVQNLSDTFAIKSLLWLTPIGLRDIFGLAAPDRMSPECGAKRSACIPASGGSSGDKQSSRLSSNMRTPPSPASDVDSAADLDVEPMTRASRSEAEGDGHGLEDSFVSRASGRSCNDDNAIIDEGAYSDALRRRRSSLTSDPAPSTSPAYEHVNGHIDRVSLAKKLSEAHEDGLQDEDAPCRSVSPERPGYLKHRYTSMKPVKRAQTLFFLPLRFIFELPTFAGAFSDSSSDFVYGASTEHSSVVNRCPADTTALDGEVASFRKAEIKDVDAWRQFVQQSISYVLSDPKRMMAIFLDTKGFQLDSMTVSVCMSRMARSAYEPFCHSLWQAAGRFYEAPAALRLLYENVGLSPEDGERFDGKTWSLYLAHMMHALIAIAPYSERWQDVVGISRLRTHGQTLPSDTSAPREFVRLCLEYHDVFSDDLAIRLAKRIFAAIPVRRHFQELLNLNGIGPVEPDILDLIVDFIDSTIDVTTRKCLWQFTMAERALHEQRAPLLCLDWARTIMLEDWKGSAEVPKDGAFGGALSLMDAIYAKRHLLAFSSTHFRTMLFATRLNELTTPVQWLSFETNRKTTHLLEHPYLFSPDQLVTYFRSINFHRMSRAHEAAGMMDTHVAVWPAPGTLLVNPDIQEYLENRLKVAYTEYFVLQIRRDHVAQDAFDQVWRREQREFARPLKVVLGHDEGGEMGFDSGGVQQEFFRLVMAEVLNPDYGAFTVDDQTRMIWFQPASPEPLWKFECIGLLVSIAVYNGLTLPITFPKALYAKLLDEPILHLHQIVDGWRDLATNLTVLLEWDESTDGLVSDVFQRTYEFSVPLFEYPVSREMVKDGKWPRYSEICKASASTKHNSADSDDVRLVDADNRVDFVNDYIKWLTDVSIRPQFEAFRRGFYSCLEPKSLRLLNTDILQSIVEGSQDISMTELRRFARYEGYDAADRIIKEFWEIVCQYNDEEKRKLLEFVTASDRIPVGGIRNVTFVISRNGSAEMDGHLPTSYTCYGTLLLPEYSSKEVLKEKLAMALENAKGFGFA